MAKNGWDLLGSWRGHGKDTDVAMLYDGLAAEFSRGSKGTTGG